MYDSSTADLIRNTPPLGGLDRDALPDTFTQAFARLAAIRVRLRAGEVAAEDLDPIRQFSKRLAQTNEVLVASSSNRENRRSAAFVAGTAYQLVYQIDILSGVHSQRTHLAEDAVTADVSAMLLFLIAESSADAADVSQRVHIAGDGLEAELLRALVDLAQGRVNRINERQLPAPERSVQSATDALYHLILHAVKQFSLALAGRRRRDDPSAILRQVQILAGRTDESHLPAVEGEEKFGALRQIAVSLFPGPYHLASLLLPTFGTLSEAATISVPPPDGIDANEWRRFLMSFAQQRPFLWPNHRDAISKLYLQEGMSSAISFPTGAGKSAVFQLKIAATLLGERSVVFLAPTHALVSQTRYDLQQVFPNVAVFGEQADDFGFVEGDLSASDVLVMTPESCLFLQYAEPTMFDGIGLLVFDECHLIHPRTDTDRRSIDAMLCVLNLVRLTPDADLLLLSAMMQNTAEVAAWVADLTGRKAAHFDMAWKPTRQIRGCVVYEQEAIGQLSNVLRQERRKMGKGGVPTRVKRLLGATPHGFFSIKQTWASRRREDYTYLPLVEDHPVLGVNQQWRLTPNAGVLAAVLAKEAALSEVKTIVFSQSVRMAAAIASRVTKSLGRSRNSLTASEQELMTVAADELGGTEKLYVDVENGELIAQAAAHHGLLLPEERELIESLFRRRGALSVLSATSTVGQGVNTPSQLVIIAEDSRFDAQTGKRELLEARELLNAAGRAGRAGQTASGVVLVIPGKVVGFDDQAAVIGERWSRLREIFSQSDQCLVIDDPLTAVLDRIHDGIRPASDLDRYVVSRLFGLEEDGGVVGRDAVGRTFGAFRKRRDEETEWIESRTEAGLVLLNSFDADDPTAENVRRLSSSLGLPEDVLSKLRVDVLDSGPRDGTLGDWCGWMFGWMHENPEQAIRMFRPDDIAQQFGAPFNRLDDDRARLEYALPKLRAALDLWMAGKPLTIIQHVFGKSGPDVRKAVGARKFVVRLLPTLAHIFSSLSAVLSEDKEARDNLRQTMPSVFFLSGCALLGLSSLEMYALYERARQGLGSPPRREIHRQFEAISPHIVPAKEEESWKDVKKRVGEAFGRAKQQ